MAEISNVNFKYNGFIIKDKKIELVTGGSKYKFGDYHDILKYFPKGDTTSLALNDENKKNLDLDAMISWLTKKKELVKSTQATLNMDILTKMKKENTISMWAFDKLFYYLPTFRNSLIKYLTSLPNFSLKFIYISRSKDNKYDIDCYGVTKESNFIILFQDNMDSDEPYANVVLVKTKIKGMIKDTLIEKYNNYDEFLISAMDLAEITPCSNIKMSTFGKGGGDNYYYKYMKYKQKYLLLKK